MRLSQASKIRASIKVAGTFLVLLCSQLRAEVVLLKDGDIFTGSIVRETPRLIVMKSAYGEIRINADDIKFIIREEKKLPVEQIQQDGKAVSARLIDETASHRVYISEDYQVIRVLRTTVTPPAVPAVPTESTSANRLEMRLGGMYSTLPFVNLDSFNEGKEKLVAAGRLEQNYAAAFAYKRQWTATWRFGLQAAGQYANSSRVDEISSFRFSRSGRFLGFSTGLTADAVIFNAGAHEFSVGGGAGMSFNSIDLNLSYPDTDSGSGSLLNQNLKGSKWAPYAELTFMYGYRFNARLQLMAVINTRMDFYRTIYQEINGQGISENALNESLKDAVQNNFFFPVHTGIYLGVAWNL